IIVDSESDALLLENNLIKKHQPRYNVLLKDDKSFPWICIKSEPFPRVFSTRNVINDGSRYYGPYTSMLMVKTILDLIRQIYPLRTCKYKLTEKNIQQEKFKLCLEYHLGNCRGPCEDLQTEDDYNKAIANIRNILKGNIQDVLSYLKKLMKQYSDLLKFEEARLIKEKIEILERYKSKSTIVSPAINNVDVFSIIDEKKYAYVNFLKVVNGAVIQAHTLEIKKKLDESRENLLLLAITEIREKVSSNANEIILPFKINVNIPGAKYIIPKRGDKRKLLELSERNVKYYRLEKRKRLEKNISRSRIIRKLENIRKDLNLKELPVHIECFDNSNLQGSHPVAACVVFRDAKPSAKDYRHYNIKSVKGPNDFASMEEVIFRRYKKLLEEKQSLPQLVIIDGGKGQLSSSLKSFEKLNLRGKIAIIGIAKKLEEIYFPGDSVPVYLDKGSETLKTIQHIRNEAHRFGISFHRQKRSKSFTTSELNNLKGIGPKTTCTVLSHFKSIKEVKKTQLVDLERVVGKSKAEIIYRYFHKT
ncbi:MAG: excinuclease ABC subunit C, partial [Bacteroidales bacterium]|nr:excinuclease ABC subunit C [Bacteroidales bacterium]